MKESLRKWEKPEITDLGSVKTVTKGGEEGDPKFLGSGDQFTNNLTT